MTSLYLTNPVPNNILSNLGSPEYLFLLPGPGAKIDFNPETDIKWGRLYNNDDGTNTDSNIHACPTVASCLYVKHVWPNGTGYVFGTSGVFNATINVYFTVKNIVTNSSYNAHIFFNGSDGTFSYGDSGESRTYGANMAYFNSIQEKDILTPHGYIPGGYNSPGVIIAGIY